jgi:hypothetical protein
MRHKVPLLIGGGKNISRAGGLSGGGDTTVSW